MGIIYQMVLVMNARLLVHLAILDVLPARIQIAPHAVNNIFLIMVGAQLVQRRAHHALQAA
jgi:hypothetical protein